MNIRSILWTFQDILAAVLFVILKPFAPLIVPIIMTYFFIGESIQEPKDLYKEYGMNPDWRRPFDLCNCAAYLVIAIVALMITILSFIVVREHAPALWIVFGSVTILALFMMLCTTIVVQDLVDESRYQAHRLFACCKTFLAKRLRFKHLTLT